MGSRSEHLSPLRPQLRNHSYVTSGKVLPLSETRFPPQQNRIIITIRQLCSKEFRQSRVFLPQHLVIVSCDGERIISRIQVYRAFTSMGTEFLLWNISSIHKQREEQP